MYIDELLGVRYWVFDEEEPFQGKTRLLRRFGSSSTSGRRGWWHHGVNKSLCQFKQMAIGENQDYYRHPGSIYEPEWKCSCGLYAYGHLHEEVINELPKGSFGNPINKIMGMVKMWGKVLTFKDLIRSQYAEMIAFFDAESYTDEMRNYVMELCVEHGYDLLDFEEFKDIEVLREYAEGKGLMLLEDIPFDEELPSGYR